MSQLSNFIKTCLLGGILVLLPLLLMFLVVSELLDIIIALATPIADSLPFDVDWKIAPILFALTLLLVFSFLFGFMLKSKHLSTLFKKLEAMSVAKLPIYSALRALGRGLIKNDEHSFDAGLLKQADGSKQLVYVIEQSDDWLTVLVPMAPTGFTGPVKIVPVQQVEKLEASVGAVSAVLSRWGHGAQHLK